MSAWSALSPGLVGLSARRADRPRVTRLAGDPVVTDTLHARAGDPTSAFRLRRDVRSFFQGNRFLLEPLVTHVTAQAAPGPVVDLYAGVGLFGLALAAAGAEPVTLVESDPVSGADLRANADAFGRHVSIVHERVEPFLGSRRRDPGRGGTYVVDPPRTGLSKEAIRGLRRLLPPRIVYVSCDVATLARDARALVDAGYEMERIDGFDLFPNTAHVETVVVFASGHRDPPS
jgi:23S rRNA (uracil1939-C5)-methyltransferase